MIFQPDLFIIPPKPLPKSKDLKPLHEPREKDHTCPQPEPTPIYDQNEQ